MTGDEKPIRHTLKTWPPFFDAIKEGLKSFDVRLDDRGYKVGERVLFIEWSMNFGIATGNQVSKVITYVMKPDVDLPPCFGIKPGYVVLGLADIKP